MLIRLKAIHIIGLQVGQAMAVGYPRLLGTLDTRLHIFIVGCPALLG